MTKELLNAKKAEIVEWLCSQYEIRDWRLREGSWTVFPPPKGERLYTLLFTVVVVDHDYVTFTFEAEPGGIRFTFVESDL